MFVRKYKHMDKTIELQFLSPIMFSDEYEIEDAIVCYNTQCNFNCINFLTGK